MILTSDLYIYLLHKLLHYKPLFTKIHIVHHKSIRVNVFSSYSLDVIESVSYTLFLAIFIFLIPTNIWNFLLFMFLTVIYNFYIHSGYEFLSNNKFPINYLNTAALHKVHHTEHDYNFAFYTNIWDRIFGTYKK
jgi:sterol desaturase/sphingolipid hydroxylase (fatty acid hydroxylase superfamily)